MQGSAHGFRWKDWTDFTTGPLHYGPHTPIDYLIGAGDGTTTQFQLIKAYTVAGVTRTRKLEKPVAGTVQVALNGAAQTLGTHFSVNTATGMITFNSAPAAGVFITAGCEFDVPVRFGLALDKFLQMSLDGFDNLSAPIPVEELVNEIPVNDEIHYRGSESVNPMGADITLAGNTPILITLNPTANNRVVNLPNPTALPTGAPWFDIINVHPTNQIIVRDHVAATVGTLLGLQSMEVMLAMDAASTKKWYAR